MNDVDILETFNFSQLTCKNDKEGMIARLNFHILHNFYDDLVQIFKR